MAFYGKDALSVASAAKKKMAKHPTSHEEIPSYVVSTLPNPVADRKLPVPAIIITVLLVGYVLASYLLLGPSQPVLIQRVLGGGCALLALAVFLMFTRRQDPTEALLLRRRMAQEFDFGKELLAQQEKPPRTVKIPLLGAIHVKFLGGLAVFALTAAWWVTPLAPVRVREAVINDLTVPFGEQIAMAILAVPDGRTAMVRPLLPPGAKMPPLRADADQYDRGMKAMAEGEFAAARAAFRNAKSEEKVTTRQINLARAQNEMFAGMIVDAAVLYADVLREQPDDPIVLMQAAVAWLYTRTPNSLATAESLTAQAWKACANLPQNERTRGLALNLQAVVLIVRGRHLEQAESLCVQAREVLEKESNTVSLLAASFNNQAVLYLIQSKYLATINLFEEARYRWGQTFGQQSPLVAACLSNQAVVQIALADFAKAEELLSNVTTIQRAQLPTDHPLTAYRLLATANLQQAQGHYKEAQVNTEEALAVIEKNYGNTFIGTLPFLSVLASIHYQLGYYEKSEAYNQAAIALGKSIFGAQHPCVADGLCRQAALLLTRKTYSEAETACEQAMAIYQEVFGKECAAMADALSISGCLEIARERPRAARQPLEQALTIRQDIFGRRHPAVASALGHLALLDNSPTTFRAGEDRFAQAIDMDKSFFDDEHPDIAHLLRGRAELLADDGKYSEAATALQQALGIQERCLPESHPELLKILVAYVAVLRKESPPDTEHATTCESRIAKLRGQYRYP